jgi:hypothetical protein
MRDTNDPGPKPLSKDCPSCGVEIGYPLKSEQLKGGGAIVHVEYHCPGCREILTAYPYKPSHDDLNRLRESGPYRSRRKRH